MCVLWWDAFKIKHLVFVHLVAQSSNTGNNSSSCRTLGSQACFGKMDGDSFGFIITPDLFIACLRSASWPTVAREGCWRLRH